MPAAVITAAAASVAPSTLAAVAAAIHHTAPTGWFLAFVVLLALLYVAWRTGRLRHLRSSAAAWRLRGEFRGLRVRPAALLPTVVLVIVVVVLLLDH